MSVAGQKHNIYRVLIFTLLLVNWIVFSGLMDVVHLSLGVISCLIVTAMSSDLLFANRDTPLHRRAKQAARMLVYLFWLVWQIVLSNLHLLKLSMGGKASLQPQIIRYETQLKSDFEKFLLANSITLTPGTVTMKILGDTYYIHAISDVTAKGLDGEMERRIAKIFS
ncbi:MAG: Na+/H+ antiporter subunit E [Verrucomicrobiota bacterium]